MIVKFQHVDYLLSKVKIIRDSYRIIEKATAQNFNIFSLLGMETAEVKTHSRFLSELLNPQGSHDQGAKFLTLFINYLNTLNYDLGSTNSGNKINLVSEQAKVEIERFIGRKTDTDGGRIDITISDDYTIIVIENKINALEGEKQMLRYSNFASLAKRNSYVFFLTLWGDKSETGDENVYSLSYQKHILEWLELCKKESVDLPVLRESLSQYINLIKKLTHQTLNRNMESDIQNLILKNAKEAELIFNNYTHTLLKLADQMVTSISSQIQEYLDQTGQSEQWEISLSEAVGGSKNRGMIWLKPKVENDNDWIIGIEDFNPLFYSPNFNKKIFMGVRSENRTLEYVNTLDGAMNQSWGSWNDYDFIKDYKNQEVRLDNAELLRLLADSGQFELFCSHVLNEFVQYFEKHSAQLLDFCKTKQLGAERLVNYSFEQVMVDQGKTAIGIVELLKPHFQKKDYQNILNVRIWNKPNETCLVFDFSKSSISVDVKPNNDYLDFHLFQRNGTELIQLMDSKPLPETYVYNGKWYTHRYTADMLLAHIIADIRERLKSVDDMLSNVNM